MKKKMLARIALAACALLVFGAAGFLWQRPDARFYLRDTWNRLIHEVRLKTWSPDGATLESHTLLNIQSGNTPFTYSNALALINRDYPLTGAIEPSILQYKESGVYMDECLLLPYAALSADITERFSNTLFVSAAYRTREKQEALFEEDPVIAALPGTSEHEAGLAVDVYVRYFAGYGFLNAPEGVYVNLNSWQHGFIIRYARGTADITGIPYEPWHLRYVGQPHAKIIYQNSLTLEGYIQSLQPGTFYTDGEFLITRQGGSTFHLPKGLADVTVSPDNTGCHILTGRWEGA